MSVMKSIFGRVPLSILPTNTSHQKENRRSSSSLNSSKISVAKRWDRSLVWGKQGLEYIVYTRIMQMDDKSRRRSFVLGSAVQPGPPPPSKPPFNFLNWVVGAVVTVVLPFIAKKWASFLKVKSGVETTIERVEDIVEGVEKAAEEVAKVAEDVGKDLPDGGDLRKAVDFVEHVAERASKDAHQVQDFIDKVQEADEKIEESLESFAEAAIKDEIAHENLQDQSHEAHKDNKETSNSSNHQSD